MIGLGLEAGRRASSRAAASEARFLAWAAPRRRATLAMSRSPSVSPPRSRSIVPASATNAMASLQLENSRLHRENTRLYHELNAHETPNFTALQVTNTKLVHEVSRLQQEVSRLLKEVNRLQRAQDARGDAMGHVVREVEHIDAEAQCYIPSEPIRAEVEIDPWADYPGRMASPPSGKSPLGSVRRKAPPIRLATDLVNSPDNPAWSSSAGDPAQASRRGGRPMASTQSSHRGS